HGYKLLRLEPRATSVLMRFLEGVKFKNPEWEPRYNLTPVPFSDVKVVRNAKPLDPAKAKAKAKADAKAKAKEDEKAKEEGKAKDDEKADDAAKAKDNEAEKQ